VRVAALYDIHGMPWALDAVLAEVDADAIVVGGDFVYGPFPEETLERVRSLAATVIRGNCERLPDDWDRRRLTAEQLAWAAALPLSAQLDGVVYCHATPDDDMPITTAATPDDALLAAFGETGTFVIGHTHHQFDRRVGRLRVVNAGSIGMPYEGDVAAFWTLVEDGEPRFMRTELDVDAAASRIRASGWPQAEEFAAENLLAAPSREEAITHFEQRRRESSDR
jgi:putative phosphoesterase